MIQATLTGAILQAFPAKDWVWYISAFASGAVNAGGYLASLRFVTHVTGFATLFATESVRSHWLDALELLSVPIFFLGGAMISGFLIDRRMRQGRQPHFGIALSLVALGLYLTVIGGAANWFGPFGEKSSLQQDYWLLTLLCMSSGIHNAAVSSATRNRARVTHMTGLTTDLGIGVMRMLGGDLYSESARAELKINIFRLGLILAFVAGGFGGAGLYLRYEFQGFLMPAMLVTIMVFLVGRIWSMENTVK